MPAGLHRRAFLAAAAGIGAVAAYPAWALARPDARGPQVSPSTGVIRSKNGVLRATLVAGSGVARTPESALGGAMTYNGVLPGPMLVVRPGDRMLIRLVNKTPLATNLHFHGFHVSPKGHQDNVFLQVDPGYTQEYDVRIPSDHSAGLFWYHPHLHGTVSDQVWGGLAGTILIEGGAADLPEISPLRRRVLNLRSVGFASDGSLQSIATAAVATNVPMLNGMLVPEIRMRPGETQFWQILNSDYATYFRLALGGRPMTIVEQDGSMAWRPEEVDTLLMAPGNRFGVLVTAPTEPGVYPLEQLGFYQGPRGDAKPATVATVRVEGPRAESVSLTRQLGSPPDYLAQKPERRRVLTLSQRTGPNIAPRFMIDGITYDEFTMQDLITVKLGTVEEWVIRNASSPLVGEPAESHPFHIHVNDFVVTERGTWNPSSGEILERRPQRARRSQDTVSVPPNEYLAFRTKFADFTGRSVYHCHVLPHEDLGMMGAFDIVDADGVGAGSGQHLHGSMTM